MRTINAFLLIILCSYAYDSWAQADSLIFEKKSNLILRNIFYAGYPVRGRMFLSAKWLVFKPKPSSKHYAENIWIKDLPMQVDNIKSIRRNWLIIWPFKLRLKMKNGRVHRFGMYGERKKLIELVKSG
jgi:hypothetical protein